MWICPKGHEPEHMLVTPPDCDMAVLVNRKTGMCANRLSSCIIGLTDTLAAAAELQETAFCPVCLSGCTWVSI